MAWIRFEVLGAERETGRPRRLIVEALTARDAETYAIEQGMLVSQVEEAGEQPGSGTAEVVSSDPLESEFDHEPDGSPERSISFGDSRVPVIPLEPGEHRIAQYSSSPREIGLTARIWRQARQAELTDRRLIVYSKGVLGPSLFIAWLRDTTTIRVASRLNLLRSILGGLLLFWGVGFMAFLVVPSAIDLGTMTSQLQLVQGAGMLHNMVQMARDYLVLLVIMGGAIVLAGIVVLLRARYRQLGVAASGEFIGITCRKLDPRRTQAFVDALDLAIRAARRRERGSEQA